MIYDNQYKTNHSTAQKSSHYANSSPSKTVVHAQLEMTTPGDHDEIEANNVADAIIGGGKIRREISSGMSGSGITVSKEMESQLSQSQGGGRTMPEGLRNMMENGFGRDFSNVRIHTDSHAAEMSDNIHAKAFTLGNDIYFNKGQYSPETKFGKHLIAHELTHVLQDSGKVSRDTEKKEGEKYYYAKNGTHNFANDVVNLAKEMIKKTIAVLDKIKDGKYLDLFKYCFGNNGNIETVLSNYNVILTKFNTVKITFLQDLKDENGTSVDGLARNKFDEGAKGENVNEILLSKSLFSFQDWSDELLTASTIIHELSHRLCGTDDLFYFGKDTRNEESIVPVHDEQGLSASKKMSEIMKKDNLTMNASSYQVFSQWVESAIYSVFDKEYTEKNSGLWNRSTYSGLTDIGNPTFLWTNTNANWGFDPKQKKWSYNVKKNTKIPTRLTFDIRLSEDVSDYFDIVVQYYINKKTKKVKIDKKGPKTPGESSGEPLSEESKKKRQKGMSNDYYKYKYLQYNSIIDLDDIPEYVKIMAVKVKDLDEKKYDFILKARCREMQSNNMMEFKDEGIEKFKVPKHIIESFLVDKLEFYKVECLEYYKKS